MAQEISVPRAPSAGRPGLFLAVGVAICIGLLVVLSVIFVTQGRDKNSASAIMAAAIDEETAALNIKPRTVELTSEKIRRVREAIARGDYSTATRVIADLSARSHLQNWSYYPFSDFMSGITDVNDPAFEDRLDAWIAQNKKDAIPVLMRAQYYFDMGWFKRGSKFAEETTAGDLASFTSYMQKASADVDAAINLDPKNPYGFDLKLRVLQGLGAPKEAMRSAFENAIAKFPGYYHLYEVVLRTLEPKWGGSVPAMYAFVDQYAGRAPQYAPLKMLYLGLYRDVLNSASTACNPYWREKDKMSQCVAAIMRSIVSPNLEDQVREALELYDHSDRYQFGVYVENALSEMLGTAGADLYSGAVLEQAAASMHSDTQLKEDHPGRNDYVIDKLVAESWYEKGFYDNALTKDREALKDVETAAFPSEEEKDVAVAGIYEHMAEVYERLDQYTNIIAYQKAALALGDKTADEYYICYGYYRLNDYDDAVRSCTKTIGDQTTNLKARYWRGSAYRDSGQTDAALRDLTVVADSEDSFRAHAAIDISMIYFNRGDTRSALDTLNKYKYLYDPNVASDEDMAVGYNNRCYAYLQLGELQEALNDCTESLKYGSIPDAFRKQQELIKRLSAQQRGL